MKRIYLAAALIVASGAGIGLLLRPAAPAQVESDTPDGKEKPKTEHASYSGPLLRTMLPPSLSAAAANRPDCFYMRVAYANSLNPGSKAGDPEDIRKQGAQAGCWMAD